MPDNKDKIKVLYDAVSSDYNVGTLDEFKSKLSDSNKRKAFYDAVSSEYDLGSLDEFNKKIDSSLKPPVYGPAPASGGIKKGELPSFQEQVETLQTVQSKYDKAVQDDRSEIGKTLSSLYNGIVGVPENLVKLATGLPAQFPVTPYQFSPIDIGKSAESARKFAELPIEERLKPVKESYKGIEGAFDLVRSGYTTREDEKQIAGQFNVFDGIGLKDFQALAAMSGGMAAEMALGAATGGATFVALGMQRSFEDFDEYAEKSGIKPDANARALYGLAGGVINGLLEKFAIDKLVGDTPVFRDLQRRAVANVLKNTANMPIDKASTVIQKAAVEEIKRLTSTIKSKGVRALYRAGVEGGTESTQAALEDGAKFAANLVQGSEVFNEEAISEGFLQNFVNSGVAGGIFGPIFGGAADVAFGRNINTQLLKDISEADTPEALARIEQELSETFDKNNFSQEERDAIMANANRYAQIKQTIPEGTSPQAQATAIPLIESRIKIDNEIETRRNALQSLDEALVPDEEYSISLLEDKRSQINDDIREVINGEKYNYFEQDGKYFKQLGENAPEEITKNRFELQKIKEDATKTSEVQEGLTAGDISQREGTQETETQEETAETDIGYSYIVGEEGDEVPVAALLNKKVRVNGQPAILYQQGQTVEARIIGTNRIIEIGNVNKLMNELPEAYNIELDEVLVTETPQGYRIEGQSLQNTNENPLDAISFDSNGNVMNVVLTTPAGKRRKFRGQVAKDLAYQIQLKEILKDEQEFENFLEREHQQELENARLQAVAEEQAAGDTEAVPAVEAESTPAASVVPVEPRYGRVTVDKPVTGIRGPRLKRKAVNDANRVVTSIRSVVSKMTGRMPEINLHDQATFEEAVVAAGASREDATARGFYLGTDGTIHINLDNVASDTVLHEGFHPILDFLQSRNPEVINKYFAELESIPEAAPFIKDAIDNYIGDVTQKKEAITSFVAGIANGDVIINPSNFQKIRKFVLDLLNALGMGVGSPKLMNVKTPGELVELADYVTEMFREGGDVFGIALEIDRIREARRVESLEQGLVMAAGEMTPERIEESKVGNTNPIQFSRPEKFKEVELVSLPTKSMLDAYNEFGGKAVAINSDPTRVGNLTLPSGKEIFMYGGLNYTALKPNVDGEIGFASTRISKPEQVARLMNTLFQDNNGEGLVLVAAQKPDSMLGNAYSLEYTLDAVSQLPKKILRSSEFKDEFFGKDIVAIKEAFGEKEYAEFVKKFRGADLSNPEIMNTMIETLLTDIGNNFIARNSLVGNMLAGVVEKSSRAATKGQPGYISVTPNKFIAKSLFDRFGLNQEKLFYEIGEKGIVDEYMNKGNWGFVTTGFTLDGKIDPKTIQEKGVIHPQFNAKFHGKNPFILDGAYLIDKLFPPEEITAKTGKPYVKKASLMVAGSMYPKGTIQPVAAPDTKGVPQFQKLTDAEKQKRTDTASEKLKQLFNRDNIPLSISEAKAIVNEVLDWSSWYDGLSSYVENIFKEYSEDVLSLLPLASQAANSATTVSLAINNAEKIYKGETPVGVAEYYGYVTDFIQGKGIKSDKMYNFFKALSGDKDAVAVDMHVWSIIMGKDPNKKQVNPKNKAEFNKAKEFVNTVANELGLAPREVQAALWAANILRTGNKPTSYEQYFEKQLEKGLEKRIEGWRDKGYKPFSEVRKAREAVRAEGKEPQFQRTAPNGKPSNLNAKQYEQVRTPAFKKWFGDWENDPSNASKVVDENGEPLVVYHGSVAPDIEIFDRSLSKRESSGLREMGVYFTTNKDLAELYSKARTKEGKISSSGKIYESFLNLRKVKEFDAKGENGIRAWDKLQVDAGYKIAQNRDAMDFLMNGKFGVEKVDGIIAKNISDMESYGIDKINELYKGTVYLVFDDNKNSIKSATDNAGTFSTTDDRIQFQKAVPTKPVKGVVRKTLKDAFNSFGLLGKDVKILQEKMSGELTAEVNKAEAVSKKAIDLAKKYKGVISNEDMEKVMTGQAPANTLPTDLADALNDAREHIDNMTERLIELGVVDNQESIDYYRQNKGKYLLRSYEAINYKDNTLAKALYGEGLNIDNVAKKLNNVDNTVVDAALKYLSNRAKLNNPSLTDAEAMKIARADANEILADSESYVTRGLKGSTNVSSLTQRKDIAPEIRALMGEYGDPIYNYYASIFKMAGLSASRNYLNELRKTGINNFLFEKGATRPEEASTLIAAEGSETLAPLNGLYTFPELAEALKTAERDKKTIIEAMAGKIRAFKTVYNPATHVKNLIGNMGFAVSNGHWNEAPETFKYIKELISGNKSKELLDLMDTLNRQGVLNSSVGIGELKSYFDKHTDVDAFLASIYDAANKQTTWYKSGKKAAANLNKIPRAIEKAYAIEDDVFKILGFVNESNRYAQAIYGKRYFDLNADQKADIKNQASEIVKNTYPTFSRVPKFLRGLSKTLFLGNFLSFPVESVRVSYNTLKLAKQEIQSGNPKLKRVGATRLAGTAVYNSLFSTISYYGFQLAGAGLTSMLGFFADDEEQKEMAKAIDRFVAPWVKEKDKYVSQFSDGKLIYWDYGSLDSYSYQKAVWNSFWSNMNDEQGFINSTGKAIYEGIKPFLALDLVYDNIISVMNNQDRFGNKIYNPEEGYGNKVMKIGAYMSKQMSPGAVSAAMKVYDYYDKGESDKMKNEIISQFGPRRYEVDLEKAFLNHLYSNPGNEIDAEIGFKNRLANARKIYTDAKKQKLSPSELDAKYQEAIGKYKEILQEVGESYRAAIRGGVDSSKLRTMIYKANLGDRRNDVDLFSIINNKYDYNDVLYIKK